MSNLLARLNRLEKAMVTKDGDVQVIATLMDELAGDLPAGAYERAIERLSRRGYSFPHSVELKALLMGDGSEKI